jgi:K+-transporting ATPase c subunit
MFTGAVVGMTPADLAMCRLNGVDPDIVIQQRVMQTITASARGHSAKSIKRDVDHATKDYVQTASIANAVGISNAEVARMQNDATMLGMLQGQSYGSAVRNSGATTKAMAEMALLNSMMNNRTRYF